MLIRNYKVFFYSLFLGTCMFFAVLVGSVSMGEQVQERPSWDQALVNRAGIGIGYRVGVRFVWDISTHLQGGSPKPTFLLKPSTSLPDGLKLSSSGIISGTPSAAGTFRFAIIASNTIGAAEKQVTLQIRDAFSNTIVYGPGQSHSDILDAQVFLNSTDCPVAQTGVGSYRDEVTAFIPDVEQAVTCYQRQYGLSVTGTLTSSTFQHFITTYNSRFVPGDFSLPPGTISFSIPVWREDTVTYVVPVNESINRDITTLLSDGYPLPTFSVHSDATLPSGLQMDISGTISGTPVLVGITTTTIVATNPSGSAAIRIVWDIQDVVHTLGSTHSDIRQAQIYLNGTPCPVARTGAGSLNQETSYFGTRTQQAIKCYQSLHQLPATSTLSSDLLNHLAIHQAQRCSSGTISSCVLRATSHNGTDGSCATGYSGSCSYRCAGGVWKEVTNTCAVIAVANTKTNVIEKPFSKDGVCDISRSEGCAVGTSIQYDPLYLSFGERWRCRGVNYGYSSEWCVRCNDGYRFNGRLCVRADTTRGTRGQCSATTKAYCLLNRSSEGTTISGKCSVGRTGSCQYVCRSGKWIRVFNTCLTVTSGSSSNYKASERKDSSKAYPTNPSRAKDSSEISPADLSRAADDRFSYSISIDGETAIVGAYYKDDNTSDGAPKKNTGAAYIFTRTGGTWSQQAKLVASDREEGDYFGYSVSLEGGTAIVGAYSEDHDVRGGNFNSAAGSAYIFTRAGGAWSQQAKIVASDRASGDNFGYAVSVDGDTAIVSAYSEDHDKNGNNSKNNAGSAYIFTRDGTTWSQQTKLVASDRDSGDYFGNSVSLDGGIAIVGAYLEDHDIKDNNFKVNAGSAYIFARDKDDIWSQQAKIVAPDRDANDSFGYSVSIDGNTAIVGAYLDNHGKTNTGSAYIFIRKRDDTWSQQEKIVASDRDVNDFFGHSVSIDGNTVIVGAHSEDHDVKGNNIKNFAGSAYIFTRSLRGIWSQQEKIVASDRDVSDNFGYSVSTYEGAAIIGAYLEDDGVDNSPRKRDAGSAYIFTCTFCGTWDQHKKIVASDSTPHPKQTLSSNFRARITPKQKPDRSTDDRFGSAVSIDGDTAIVGSHLDDHGGTDAGSAYIFVRNKGIWKKQTEIVAEDGSSDDYFGYSVSIDGDTAIVGAYGAGAAYIFARNGGIWNKETKIMASDRSGGGRFGYSVSIDGDTAIVGAYGAEAAYIFIRTGDIWSEQSKITAFDQNKGDHFGRSVSINGSTVIVGAHLDDQGATDAGSAYIFTRSILGTWSQQAKIVASDGDADDSFGFSVSIDGNTAIVGAYHEDNDVEDSNRIYDAGSAYIFFRDKGTWSQQAKIIASDRAKFDYFGYSVSIDGGTAVVGAYLDDHGATDAGSAYIFARDKNTWKQQAKIAASDRARFDYFGRSVFTDGSTVIVGAYLEDHDVNGGSTKTNAGSAYIFTRSLRDTWNQQAKVVAPGIQRTSSVACSNNECGCQTIVPFCLQDGCVCLSKMYRCHCTLNKHKTRCVKAWSVQNCAHNCCVGCCGRCCGNSCGVSASCNPNPSAPRTGIKSCR